MERNFDGRIKLEGSSVIQMFLWDREGGELKGRETFKY
jgi:hypothetical protein